jgi:hypothetical protein
LQRQEEHEGQRQDGGDDQLGVRPGVVVDVISGSAAGRAPALYHRPSALCADQVFATHRNPFRLARVLAVTVM